MDIPTGFMLKLEHFQLCASQNTFRLSLAFHSPPVACGYIYWVHTTRIPHTAPTEYSALHAHSSTFVCGFEFGIREISDYINTLMM